MTSDKLRKLFLKNQILKRQNVDSNLLKRKNIKEFDNYSIENITKMSQYFSNNFYQQEQSLEIFKNTDIPCSSFYNDIDMYFSFTSIQRQTDNLQSIFKQKDLIQHNLQQKQENLDSDKINNQELNLLLLNDVQIKEQSIKSSNLSKFLVKVLRNNLQQEVNIEKSNKKGISSKLKMQKYLNKHCNIRTMQKLLKDDQHEDKAEERLIMRNILRKCSKNEIIKNNHVHHKKSYLIASKVYSLRCMSSLLIGRMQFS